MNRHVVAGLLGPALALSLAGCLNDRAAVSPARPTMPPVDLSGTLPSIHQAINKENPHIDPDSMRAGHPSEPVNRPRPPYVAASRGPAAVPTAPTVDGRPAVDGPAATDLPAGRPAPFAETVPDGPRPRADARPVSAAADEPAAPASDAPVAADVPAAADARPALDSPAPNATPAPAAEPAAPPVEPQAPAAVLPPIGPNPDDRVKSELPAPAPTSEPSTPADLPAPESAPTPLPAGPSPAPVRDPLLGANPDIMPSMDTLPTPGGPSPKAAEGAPAELPAIPDTAAAQAEPSSLPPAASYFPPADAGQPPPIGQMDKNVRPGGAPEASSTPKGPDPGPAVGPDPLLGATPDVMPPIAPPAAKGATEPSIRPEAGEPPPILEMEKTPLPGAPEASARPSADPAPTAVAPPTAVPPADPTAFAAGFSDPPSPASDVPQQATPPADVSRPATVVRPDVSATKTDRPRVIEVGPKAVPPAAPVARDPLLGANPDIMPPMDQIPKAPVRRPASAPSTPSASVPAPTGVPPLTAPPAPAEPPALPAPAAAQPAAPAEGPVELPPLGDPQASAGRGRGREGFASVPVSAPPAGTRDAATRPASNSTPSASAPAPASEPTAVRSQVSTRKVFTIGMPAARIGDDVITLYELKAAYVKRLDSMGMRGQKIPEESSRALLQSVLNDLIDRSVVLQEARRELKDAKKYKGIMDVADKYWGEEELPPLLRKTASANIYELKQKMSERGESLDELREQFRLEFLSKGYLEQKLGPRMKVELPEMHEYYLGHLKDFDRPAQITWREAVVEVEKCKSRTEARAKIDALLARLRRGEDFAALAKSASDGPSKSDGGLWQTSPGSYSVPAVNTALESLPVGQISPVLEGPTSFHIVRVEGRRRAGPATFAEVQDKIKRVIRQEKIMRESTAYLDKLRSQTVIWTAFDDPNAPRSTGRRTIPARR